MAGQLAAFARLGALGDLDLNLLGIDQVIAVDAEAARRHLLDRRALRIRAVTRKRQKTRRILAALAGVAFPAQAVHRYGKRLVGLCRDRTKAHRPRAEALHDLSRRLDLLERENQQLRGTVGADAHASG